MADLAHTQRLAIWAEHGEPKAYGGSDMMREDVTATLAEVERMAEMLYRLHVGPASAVSPSQAQSEAPDAWLRKDGMKAMPADEKEAWKEAGQPEIVEDYTIPLYRAAGIQSPPAPSQAQSNGPFFRPADLATAIMTPEQEAAVRDLNWCWKCACALVVDVHREGGMRWMQCKHCTTVYALKDGVSPSQAQCDVARGPLSLSEIAKMLAEVGADPDQPGDWHLEFVRRIEAAHGVAAAGIQSPAAPVGGEVDAEAAIAAGFENHGYRQGTKECIAFYRGACWQRASSVLEAQPQPTDQGEKNG